MKYIIGMDFQASHISACVFTEDAQLVCNTRADYPAYEKDGVSFANPDDWKDAAFALIKRVITEYAVDPASVAGIAFCGHPIRVAMLDGEGRPVCDSRQWAFGNTMEEETGRMCEVIGADQLNRIAGKTKAVEGALGPFILYSRTHAPAEMAACRKILYGKDYITYHLTGCMSMDISDASGSMLLDVERRAWSDEILSALDIPKELLPDVYRCTETIGTVTAAAAEQTGLAEGTPVFAGLTNKAAIALTSGAVKDGSSVPTVSYSCDIVAISSKYIVDENRAVEVYCSPVGDDYYTIVRNRICADAIGWFGGLYLNGIFEMPKGKGGTPFKPVEEIAAKTESGSGGVIFIPYLKEAGLPALENAKGMFFGITPQTTKEDMVRAVLEGASFSVLDCFGCLADAGLVCTDNYYHMMGTAPYWLQMLADMTGYPALVSGGAGGAGGPALGAVMIAALGSGICKTREECVNMFITEKDNKTPDPETHALYRQIYQKYRSLCRAFT